MKDCVICGAGLTGHQRLFCSNRCKQADKYDRKRGMRCIKCHKPIKVPHAVLGGFRQTCDRKACLTKKEKQVR